MEDYCLIPLGGKYGKSKFAKVDPDDYEKLSKHGWSVWHGYPNAMIKGKVRTMHRLLMGEPKGMCVDHINHDTLDNRKGNLRICTLGQNNINTVGRKNRKSKYKGVYYRPLKKLRPWCARGGYNGGKVQVGYFDTELTVVC
jgi:hypothetical protein